MMRYLLAFLALFFAAGTALAAEINDLSPVDYGQLHQPQLLGLPSFLWWAAGVWALAALVLFLTRYSAWLQDRICEPSSYVASAVFLIGGGLFVDSLTLDPSPLGQGLMLAGVVFAFLGLIGNDREGPLL